MKKSIVWLSALMLSVIVFSQGSLMYTGSGRGHDVNEDISIGSFTYQSSIDNIDDLYARYAYPEGAIDLPVVVLMHGFNHNASVFSEDTLARMAGYGLFIIVPGMRGRDGAGGEPDCSAREVYDIVDAVSYARERYPGIVSPDRAAVVGYSGGGGDALACAVKFPDTFTDVIDHFGISDYGLDDMYGWYDQNTAYRGVMESRIGGTPETVPDAYYARAHLYGLPNYEGYIYFFHDRADRSVPVDQTLRCMALLGAHGSDNFTADITGPGSGTRWLHAMPEYGEPVCLTENKWAPALVKGEHPVWAVPKSGSLRVMGYVVTKRFTIWLGNGTQEAADITYDVSSGTYSVQTLTGKMNVSITQGGREVNERVTGYTVIYV